MVESDTKRVQTHDPKLWNIFTTASQFGRLGQIRWTRKNGASRFLILHTFNIVAQNENILKHSSSSSCKDLDINEKWKSSVNPNFNKNRFSIYIHFISLNWSKRNKCLSDIWNITSCCYFVHVNRPIALAKQTKRWISKENERLHFFMSNVFVPTGWTVQGEYFFHFLLTSCILKRKIIHSTFHWPLPKSRQNSATLYNNKLFYLFRGHILGLRWILSNKLYFYSYVLNKFIKTFRAGVRNFMYH